MARPAKRKAEKKDVILHIRVTVEDKGHFEAAAAHNRMDLSTFARVAMLEKARASGFKI